MKVEPIYSKIGLRVTVLREMKGLDQATLARRIGLSRGSVANIETGRQRIMVHTLIDIAAALGTKAEFLCKA